MWLVALACAYDATGNREARIIPCHKYWQTILVEHIKHSLSLVSFL